MARPVRIVRGRFTEVVEAGPDEFPYAVRKVVMLDEVVFRKVGPSAVLDVV